MSVCCECCVLSGRSLCDGLITRPEEYYRVWCIWVWPINLVNEEALSHCGLLRQNERTPLTTDLYGSRNVLQLLKKFPASYGTRKLFTILDVVTVYCVPQTQNTVTNTISSVYTGFQNFKRLCRGKDLHKTWHFGHGGRVQVWLYSFLTLLLDGGGWSAPNSGRFTPEWESR
jgi:hypothetical protein